MDALQQIMNHEELLLSAMKSSDIPTLEALLHDDLIFIIPTGQTVTKEQDIANHRSGLLRIDHLSAKNQQISFVEGNAIVSVIINLQGSYAGESIASDFKYLRVWKEFSDGWKVIGGAGMQI
jgi:ketosteroid isomerase-like protein